MTLHVLVIGGGQNAEHDVSLETAAAIENALRSRGFEATTITIGRDGRWRHREEPLGESAAHSVAGAMPFVAQADVIFPAVHGPLGEDGTLAALCALTHKPVVGSGLRAGAIGMDKWATKLVAVACHGQGIDDTALARLKLGGGPRSVIDGRQLSYGQLWSPPLPRRRRFGASQTRPPCMRSLRCPGPTCLGVRARCDRPGS